MRRRQCAIPVIATAFLITACGVIPGAPDPGPTEWIPSVDPSATPIDVADGQYGFTSAEQAAVRVRNSGCEDFGTGSGFAIDDHTIITNRHVVDNYEDLALTTSDGRDLKVASASTSTLADIAIITTVETLEHYVPLSEDDPELGDTVTVVGFPLGEELVTSTGLVKERADDNLDNADHIFVVSAAAEPGSSGSGAYNADGEVFGVLYAGEDATKWGYIIPVSIIRDALADSTPIGPSCDY